MSNPDGYIEDGVLWQRIDELQAENERLRTTMSKYLEGSTENAMMKYITELEAKLENETAEKRDEQHALQRGFRKMAASIAELDEKLATARRISLFIEESNDE